MLSQFFAWFLHLLVSFPYSWHPNKISHKKCLGDALESHYLHKGTFSAVVKKKNGQISYLELCLQFFSAAAAV
jgi:hypothetical protein